MLCCAVLCCVESLGQFNAMDGASSSSRPSRKSSRAARKRFEAHRLETSDSFLKCVVVVLVVVLVVLVVVVVVVLPMEYW